MVYQYILPGQNHHPFIKIYTAQITAKVLPYYDILGIKKVIIMYNLSICPMWRTLKDDDTAIAMELSNESKYKTKTK